jgi:hypothetical protein
MKSSVLLTFLLLFFLCLAAGLGYALFVRTANQQITHVLITVDGSVEMVEIYAADDPIDPIYSIETYGEETMRFFQLANAQPATPIFQAPPAQYIFIAQAGGEEYRSSPFCCQTSITPGSLSLRIYNLESWEVTEN